MTNNKAFWRALRGLAHPVTILAVVLLLVNDHWLRWTLPSWWTGKAGDFAWLLFAPFICALLLAWLIPARWPHQERVVGRFSFAFIGLWFALAKTIPAIHALTTSTLDRLVGWQGGLRMDATDLITLPALLIGWHIWRKARNAAPSVPLGWVVSALGLMGTLATSCDPVPLNTGITLLCQQDNVLYASMGDYGYIYGAFTSSDGGLTWVALTNDDEQIDNTCLQPEQPQTRMDKLGGQYDFVPGKGIYHVEQDQAQILIFDLSPYRHDSYKVLREGPKRFGPCSIVTTYTPGPHDALIDEQSGNLIFAMGHSGVLVNTGGDDWQWVAVGDYRHVKMDEPASVLGLLRPELILALGLLVLVPPALAQPGEKLRWYGVTALIIGWGLWGLAILLNRTFFKEMLVSIAGIPLVIIAIALTLWAANHVFVQRRSTIASVMLVTLTLGITLLFLLPFVLWARRTVPNHGTATIFALLLAGGALFTAGPYFQWRFPARKKKKKYEEIEATIEDFDTYTLEDDED